MKTPPKKYLVISLIFIAPSLLAILAENTFYQHIDERGVLHESLFMPISVILFVIGLLFLLFYVLGKIRTLFK